MGESDEAELASISKARALEETGELRDTHS